MFLTLPEVISLLHPKQKHLKMSARVFSEPSISPLCSELTPRSFDKHPPPIFALIIVGVI